MRIISNQKHYGHNSLLNITSISCNLHENWKTIVGSNAINGTPGLFEGSFHLENYICLVTDCVYFETRNIGVGFKEERAKTLKRRA